MAWSSERRSSTRAGTTRFLGQTVPAHHADLCISAVVESDCSFALHTWLKCLAPMAPSSDYASSKTTSYCTMDKAPTPKQKGLTIFRLSSCCSFWLKPCRNFVLPCMADLVLFFCSRRALPAALQCSVPRTSVECSRRADVPVVPGHGVCGTCFGPGMLCRCASGCLAPYAVVV